MIPDALEELLESGETAGNDWVPGFVFANTKGRWIRKIKTGKKENKKLLQFVHSDYIVKFENCILKTLLS